MVREELRAPQTAAEWIAYHDIRRHVLFELRGHGSAYDANHPDEHLTGHHPLVLWVDGGVLRIDVENQSALYRRVAVRPDRQRQGYGRRILELAAEFARKHGCDRVISHVDADAVGFYERCGFLHLNDSADSSGVVLMGKAI